MSGYFWLQERAQMVSFKSICQNIFNIPVNDHSACYTDGACDDGNCYEFNNINKWPIPKDLIKNDNQILSTRKQSNIHVKLRSTSPKHVFEVFANSLKKIKPHV